MRISSHTTEYIELTMSYEEAVKINRCDPETVNEFGEHIRKYCQSIVDAKRIRTKQILDTVSNPKVIDLNGIKIPAKWMDDGVTFRCEESIKKDLKDAGLEEEF
jgi:hypothetical protein